MSEGKTCKKCGVWKELEGFPPAPRCADGREGSCKTCKNKKKAERYKVKERWLPAYQTHQVCNKCGRCLPIEEFGGYKKKNYYKCKECVAEYTLSRKPERAAYIRSYYAKNAEDIRKKSNDWYYENKERANARDKKWGEENKEKKQERDRQYSGNNKEKIRRRVREFSRSPANWETYGARIPITDEPRDANGVVEVVCKNCRSRFIPTALQCQQRIVASQALDKGDANFYCSEKCKYSCDIYRAKKLPTSQRHRRSRARSCQQDVKRSLIASQCADKGMVQCEVCGDIGSVDLHHTLPVKGYEDKISEAASMMLVCAGCHAKIHRRCK